jgi:BioD-like phosphotransacetylase family protein
MTPVFILSNRSYSGKTFLALGLALKLLDKGYKVGYIKPLGRTPVKKGMEIYDADALFMKDALSLPEPMDIISPFVLDYERMSLIYEGRIKDAKNRIIGAVRGMKDKDFVLIGGGGEIFEGAMLDISALDLMDELNASAIAIEAWSGDEAIDAFFGIKKLLGERFKGGVINKVPLNALSHVKGAVRQFLERSGICVFGVFQKDSILEAISVRQINEILNGKVMCCEDRLDEFVENFSIGAMDVDSALSYFRKLHNKAVITGAHRSDIQLAAMETSTKCIILTGGLYANDVVIGRAQSKGIPVISAEEDTFTIVDRIESVMGKTRLREISKIDRAKNMIDKEFDLRRFLECKF